MKKVEDAIQRAVIVWCDAHPLFKAPFRFHIKNEGVLSRAEGAIDKKMGKVAGVPDLCFILPHGRVVWLELKKKTGRKSKVQESLHESWTGRLQVVYVAYGYDHAIAILETVAGWCDV